MLSVLYNGTNIIGKVWKNSIKIKEALNNRTNTASFEVNDMVIEEGTLCEIREGTFLLGNVVSSSVLPLGDMFELSEKFRPWTVLFLDFENWREKVIVQSIDYFAREITIDKTVSYVSWTKIWQLLFGWVITNAPQWIPLVMRHRPHNLIRFCFWLSRRKNRKNRPKKRIGPNHDRANNELYCNRNIPKKCNVKRQSERYPTSWTRYRDRTKSMYCRLCTSCITSCKNWKNPYKKPSLFLPKNGKSRQY